MPSDLKNTGQVTTLLHRWTAGDTDARGELIAFMYPELKRIAESRMREERSDHTLQATALVSEFFLQLARREEFVWQNRAHFLAVASQAMKRLLIDYARSQGSGKRGGGQPLIQLDGLNVCDAGRSPDVLEIDELLELLWKEEPRMAQIVEMRCFGGLTNKEIAEAIGVDERTVKRDWQVARAWLSGHLRKGGTKCPGRNGSGSK
jgi:RNA polymerase sigma-70 factor, ECF subfamily